MCCLPFYLTLKAYYILDELLIAGELQESSKKTVARLIAAQVLSPLSLQYFCYDFSLADMVIDITL